ncbi:MAG: hypothetical protein A4E69_01199 [Syntrophus sp. PtaB.Bin138]|nr:MAG: hypothetical protein A4E69_01199 [Syntrophus sp. PtaB.Bin138]
MRYAVPKNFQTFTGRDIDQFQCSVLGERAVHVNEAPVESGRYGHSKHSRIQGRYDFLYGDSFRISPL